MNNKPRLLCWSDFFGVGTGFGTVSKYVIQSLLPYFQIDQLAINYHGAFFDQTKWPVQVVPAKLNNPSDPHGNQMFVESLMSGKYDYIWIMNDSFVVHKTAKEFPKIFETMSAAKKKLPVIVYYCPIDCNLQSHASGMVQVADRVVAYCEFGKQEILKTLPQVSDKLSVITHGVDTSVFHRVNPVDRRLLRSQLLKINDDETFVWMNVNRNSPRKDLARTILAFSEFKKQVPNSKLYLHTQARDTTIDLLVAVKDLGLTTKDDVLFPANYGPDRPFAPEILNSFYNCSDAFITTSLGEGWGLTHLDAALVGNPIVAPDNTSFTEQLKGRGYLYPCKEKVWIDNSGYRPIGCIDDIVNSMMQCYTETKNKTNTKLIMDAKEYAMSLNWTNIGKQWVSLFKGLVPTKHIVPSISGTKL